MVRIIELGFDETGANLNMAHQSIVLKRHTRYIDKEMLKYYAKKKNSILVGSGCDGTAHQGRRKLQCIRKEMHFNIGISYMIRRVFENTCDRAGMLEKG